MLFSGVATIHYPGNGGLALYSAINRLILDAQATLSNRA